MKTGTGPGGRPGNMVHWNLLTAAGVVLCVAGVLWTKGGGGDMARWLALLGAVLFLLSMAGGIRCSAAHPPRCPVCGCAQRPGDGSSPDWAITARIRSPVNTAGRRPPWSRG